MNKLNTYPLPLDYEEYIILDVDRTIVNTTTWYHACITPNLLIPTCLIAQFKENNKKEFGHAAHSVPSENFRISTLEMIERNHSIEFINLIKCFPDWFSIAKFSEFTGKPRLYLAGKYIALKLSIYNEVVQLLKIIKRIRGNSCHIIFLSSGYQDFIQGFIDHSLDILGISCSYSVVGSSLLYSYNGKVSEESFICQFKKATLVNDLIDKGKKIPLLADDSCVNENLFSLVEKNQGKALRIAHTSGQLSSPTWVNYINDIYKNNSVDYLHECCPSIKLVKNYNRTNFTNFIHENSDQIGLYSLSKKNYLEGEKILLEYFKSSTEKKAILHCLRNQININRFDSKVLLRDHLYYYWLPPSILMRPEPLFERWKESLTNSLNAISIIPFHLMEQNNSINTFTLTICYSFLDHLLNTLLSALNIIGRANLEFEELSEKFLELEDVVATLSKARNIIFLKSFLCFEELSKIKYYNFQELELLVKKYINYHKGNRELDDAIAIFDSVQRVCDKAVNIDYLLTFPYGGIELGYALQSAIALKYPKLKTPVVIACYYSSKKEPRGECPKVEYNSLEWMCQFVPHAHKGRLADIIKGGKNILLYDNNVTTFSTLSHTREYCRRLGNNTSSVAVAVNYENLEANIHDKSREPLVDDWRSVLSYKPVRKYITAFNTWKTGSKSSHLEKMLISSPSYFSLKSTQAWSETERKNLVVKLCRVHNSFDLAVGVNNGISMIGIHAVYPDRLRYLVSQLKHSPLMYHEEINVLPVATLEVASIRAMQKYIPKSIDQVLLFEKELEISKIIDTCLLYNLPLESIRIQFQHRVSKKFVQEVRQNISSNIIVAVGILQRDFTEYLDYLNTFLDPVRDFVLLDFSSHQPDLISQRKIISSDKYYVDILKKKINDLSFNKIPLLIADDTSVEQLKRYIYLLKSNSISISGIDIQNIVELPSNEQQYQILSDEQDIFQGKLRKCPTKTQAWYRKFWEDDRAIT